jgi:hypothetical protein
MPAPLSARRAVGGNLRLEVAEALPVEAAVEVDLGDGEAAPLVGLCQRLAVVAVDGGDHPVSGGIGVGAADQIHVVFTGAGGTEQGIAAPHRPRNHLRSIVAESPGDLGEEAIIADHHADLAEARVKDRVAAARADAALNLAAWQADLAVFADDLALGAD